VTTARCGRAGYGDGVNTCSTCRFFGSEHGFDVQTDADDYVTTDHHTCVRIIHGNGHVKYDEPKRLLSESAAVVDGSGYAARLVVLPTFGCVLHEPKPALRNST
jgi:hypothetical protein